VKTEYTYGGDYNKTDPSDNNFNCNGMIGPDRQLNPHAYEVAYEYQNIWARPVDLKQGKIAVHNEYFFRDLSNYRMEWSLVNEGKVVEKGAIEELNVAPQQTVEYTLPIAGKEFDGEVLLNIDFKLKTAEPLMAAGQTVAEMQMEVQPWQPMPKMEPVAKNKVKVTDNVKEGVVRFAGNNFDLVFDRKTGFLSSYQVDGRNFLGEGGSLKPNFWRAMTDNDMGTNFQNRLSVWKNPTMTLKSLEVDKKMNRLTAEYDLPQVGGQLCLVYHVASDGALHVSMDMEMKEGSKAPQLPRFGMLMQLPYNMDKLVFYGRGPIENYADRKLSQRIGCYEQTADKQFFPYIRPQETGTKSDIRWWQQTDNSGRGFRVLFDETAFSASALHYNISDLDEGSEKHQRHSYQVPLSKYTNLTLDAAMMGVGGIDSWGSEPLKEYQLPAENRAMHFWIVPVF